MPGETIAIWDNVKAGDRISTKIPSRTTLYHYTTFEPFTRIVDSGSIWASNIFYLNDSEEVLYGFKKIASQTSVIERQSSDSEIPEICHQLRGWLLNNAGNFRQVFVCCLSENGNQLSQWRAYCSAGKGVSFGLDMELLVERAKSSGFQLARCIYDDAEQLSMVEAVISKIIGDAKEAGPDEKAAPEQNYHTFFENNAEAIYSLCAQLKHPSFKEEAEWRLISPPLPTTIDSRIEYRQGSSTLVPYIQFYLRDEGAPLSIAAVIVGPTPNINLSMSAVSNFVSSRNVKGVVVYNSSIPYRPW